jgi:hypothetical protein
MYVFRAWVDEHGWNVDREHGRCQGRCRHLRLGDLNREDGGNIIRWVYRRWPPYLSILIGRRYWPVLRLGRR